MSRKNPHLNAEGKPKHPFPHSGPAWQYIDDLIDAGRMAPGIMHAYECDVCHRWHVGKNHSTKRRRRNRLGAW